MISQTDGYGTNLQENTRTALTDSRQTGKTRQEEQKQDKIYRGWAITCSLMGRLVNNGGGRGREIILHKKIMKHRQHFDDDLSRFPRKVVQC